jgi:dolichol kinase
MTISTPALLSQTSTLFVVISISRLHLTKSYLFLIHSTSSHHPFITIISIIIIINMINHQLIRFPWIYQAHTSYLPLFECFSHLCNRESFIHAVHARMYSIIMTYSQASYVQFHLFPVGHLTAGRRAGCGHSISFSSLCIVLLCFDY